MNIKDCTTLVVIAQPKQDVFQLDSSEVSMVSSMDSRIELSVGSKHREQECWLTLQVIYTVWTCTDVINMKHASYTCTRMLCACPSQVVDIHRCAVRIC